MTKTEAYNTVRNYIMTDAGQTNQFTRGALAGLDALVGWIKYFETESAVANARIAELEAQLAKPATIHEVIDDFGETVTAVTL